jgi:hypothetical protein
MILDAIATHPMKAESVVMIATDGIYFTARHPKLDAEVSDALGAWSVEEKHDLCCFKPGVYWDNHSRELINAGKTPKFKARGINAHDFSRSIATVDSLFDSWDADRPDSIRWPTVQFSSRFSQISCLQALQRTAGVKYEGKREGVYRGLAGSIRTNIKLQQDSRPEIKRNPGSIRYDVVNGLWRTEPWDHRGWPESTPYERRFGTDGEQSAWDEYSTPDGSVLMGFREALLSG